MKNQGFWHAVIQQHSSLLCFFFYLIFLKKQCEELLMFCDTVVLLNATEHIHGAAQVEL